MVFRRFGRIIAYVVAFLLILIVYVVTETQSYSDSVHTRLADFYKTRGDANSYPISSMPDQEEVRNESDFSVNSSLLLQDQWSALLLDASGVIAPGTPVGDEFLGNRGTQRRMQVGQSDLCAESADLREAKLKLLSAVGKLFAVGPSKSAVAISILVNNEGSSPGTTGKLALAYQYLFRLSIDELRYAMYCKKSEETLFEQGQLLANMMECASDIDGVLGMTIRHGVYRAMVGVFGEYFSVRAGAGVVGHVFDERANIFMWDGSAFERTFATLTSNNLEALVRWVDGGGAVEAYPVSTLGKSSKSLPILGPYFKIRELERYLELAERDWQALLKNGNYEAFEAERDYVDRFRTGWEDFGITAAPTAELLAERAFTSVIASEWDHKMVIDLLWLGLQLELYYESYVEYPKELLGLDGERNRSILDAFAYYPSGGGYRIECLYAAFPAEMPILEVDSYEREK